MHPVPSLIHHVSLRLGLVISASQIIILTMQLNPLTPATQCVHISLPGPPQLWHLFFGQFLMTLFSNVTSSLSLYWSCTEVCSRNAHSCHTVMSLKSLNPNLSGHLSRTFSKSLIPSYKPSLWLLPPTNMGPDTPTSWPPSTCTGCLREKCALATQPHVPQSLMKIEYRI